MSYNYPLSGFGAASITKEKPKRKPKTFWQKYGKFATMLLLPGVGGALLVYQALRKKGMTHDAAKRAAVRAKREAKVHRAPAKAWKKGVR